VNHVPLCDTTTSYKYGIKIEMISLCSLPAKLNAKIIINDTTHSHHFTQQQRTHLWDVAFAVLMSVCAL